MSNSCSESSIFQSTHPVRGATEIVSDQTADIPISIHAPREGCDLEAMRIS